LSLEDIEAEFRPHQIRTARSLIRLPGSLYEQVLQDAFAPLPEPLRRLHSPAGKCCASGLARIDGADGWIARRVAGVFGFPPTGENIPVTVEITASAGQETWHRDFGGRRFVSVLTASPIPGCLVERFGPFVFTLDLRVGPRGVLGMPVRAWRLGPIPLPGFLAPKSLATETVDPDGRFQFDVEMRLPLGLGRVVRYRGWLVPDAGSAAA
jgi:hypothetical protein